VEYSALVCTLEVVKDVGAAIDHIHKHGRWFSEFC
jgi:gamma-glutamyl phosphate reductase